jgi:hypothetical protein
MTRLVLTAVVLTSMAFGIGAQTPRPMPERAELFKATEENLARAQREQGRYAYKERRTELHTNPFGKIGTGGTRVYEVVPGPEPGVVFRTLLEEDGVKVTEAKPERQERRGRGQSRGSIDDVVATLDFTMQRRERLDGRDAIVVTFAAKPAARPQTREGKMAKLFTGTIWIDESTREVMRVEGTAVDTMSFGLGMVARLNEGTRVSLVREPIDGDLWLPTSVRFVGTGRAMLFRKLNVDYAVDWFDYRKR